MTSQIKRSHWEYAYLLVIAGIALCLDQGSKLWVRATIPAGETWAPLAALSPYARFVHSGNTGMALGIARSMNGLFIALSEVACISILVLYPYLIRRGDSLLMGAGLGLVLGGAVGNLIDRVLLGYVTDILLLNLLPVVNFADLCIIAGAILVAIGLLKGGARAGSP
jgi:signal peptidase II